MRFSVVLAGVTIATVAFGQGSFYAVGYAANLNIGDSVVNITNDGTMGGFYGAVAGSSPAVLTPTAGNICVNTYVFDPQEEEIGCCACLVSPNGLNSLSAKSDLISNNLTPAVPTSIVIKLLATEPALDPNGGFTVCNAAAVAGAPRTAVSTLNFADFPYYSVANGGVKPAAGPTDTSAGFLALGMNAWGATLEPNGSPGGYNAVNVPFNPYNNALSFFLPGPQALINLSNELSALQQVCNFIQANGSGFGICKSCRLGGLGGAKK